jgi:hypothetical protein
MYSQRGQLMKVLLSNPLGETPKPAASLGNKYVTRVLRRARM